jgi:hypothetical protein
MAKLFGFEFTTLGSNYPLGSSTLSPKIRLIVRSSSSRCGIICDYFRVLRQARGKRAVHRMTTWRLSVRAARSVVYFRVVCKSFVTRPRLGVGRVIELLFPDSTTRNHSFATHHQPPQHYGRMRHPCFCCQAWKGAKGGVDP